MTDQSKLPEPSQQDVQNIVDSWVSLDKFFTKYDVTKQLRHDGFWAKHDVVKGHFENIDIPDEYSTTFLQIQGNPLLFHLEGTDPTDYDQFDIPIFTVDQTDNDDGSTTVNIKTNTATGKSPASDLFDNRKRFSVSAKNTRKAGFGKYNVVRITTNSGCIEICEDNGSGRKATVDCYFNIRVPMAEFENAFDNIPTDIKVHISDKKIEITEN